jgi:hypothetical protein
MKPTNIKSPLPPAPIPVLTVSGAAGANAISCSKFQPASYWKNNSSRSGATPKLLSASE